MHLLHTTGGYSSYLASTITGNLCYAIFAEFSPFGDGKGNGSMPLTSSSQQAICNHKTLVYIRRFSLASGFPSYYDHGNKCFGGCSLDFGLCCVAVCYQTPPSVP